MKVRALLIPAVALSLFSCGGSSTQTTPQGQPQTAVTPNVEVTVAVTGKVADENTYTSTVLAYATNNISPQTASRIRKINVEVGDYVRKGQVLAEMDRLQLEQTALQLRNDSLEYHRLKALLAEGGVTQSDFDAIALAYEVRKTTYENLRENTILKSPVTGYVTARNYDVNDLYAMSQPLFTVQQVVPVKLLVGISESEYTKVKRGDQVSLTADAFPGRTFTGKVERLYPTMNAATHTFNAEVVVQNADRALRPGMFARVTVNFGTAESVLLPDQAIVKQEGTGQRFVYLLEDDGTVSFVPVEIGRHIGTTWQVTSGVSKGQKVVVKGQTALKDGVKVNVL